MFRCAGAAKPAIRRSSYVLHRTQLWRRRSAWDPDNCETHASAAITVTRFATQSPCLKLVPGRPRAVGALECGSRRNRRRMISSPNCCENGRSCSITFVDHQYVCGSVGFEALFHERESPILRRSMSGVQNRSRVLDRSTQHGGYSIVYDKGYVLDPLSRQLPG